MLLPALSRRSVSHKLKVDLISLQGVECWYGHPRPKWHSYCVAIGYRFIRIVWRWAIYHLMVYSYLSFDGVQLFITWWCTAIYHLMVYSYLSLDGVQLFITWWCTAIYHLMVYSYLSLDGVQLFIIWWCTAIYHLVVYRRHKQLKQNSYLINTASQRAQQNEAKAILA